MPTVDLVPLGAHSRGGPGTHSLGSGVLRAGGGHVEGLQNCQQGCQAAQLPNCQDQVSEPLHHA